MGADNALHQAVVTESSGAPGLPRWFLVRNVHAKDEPMRLVQPRWAMSFLQGPTTRLELQRALQARAAWKAS